ncbi:MULTISPECIES: flagellar protein FlaG [Mesobacillus]|nr:MULTISPECIES: flagellar protein FlaG [Mesobacillus]MDQ0413466.1 flagellar protein FlaG [Mesobacillus stamsii]
MIERLSSNSLSSQPRSIAVSDAATMIQDRDTEKRQDSPEEVVFPKEKVKEIVDSVNKFLEASPTALKFEFHEKLNEYYVKIIDEKTKETIREIPPKKMLDFYAAMTEFLGLLVDKKI